VPDAELKWWEIRNASRAIRRVPIAPERFIKMMHDDLQSEKIKFTARADEAVVAKVYETGFYNAMQQVHGSTAAVYQHRPDEHGHIHGYAHVHTHHNLHSSVLHP
jgi:hypothetical protein